MAERALDVWRMKKAVKSGAATHVHVHYATFAHLSELAALDYSLHVHGGDVLLDRVGRIKRALVDRGLLHASRVVVSTPDLLPIVRSLRADAIYLRNPMPVGELREQSRPSVPLRLLVLSKMDYLKGWPQQVAILNRIRRLAPNLEIFFFGKGQLPELERNRLRQSVAELGARELELMPRDTFLETLPKFDLALGQQEVGSLGMSEMEAMACGVPVLAEVGAHRAIGCDPPVLTAGDLSTLGASAFDREHLHELGTRGRQFIRDNHDPTAVLRALTFVLDGNSR